MLITTSIIPSSGVAFGTSGARGLVSQFTPDVCAAFTHAFVAVMRQSFAFERVALAIDNRPSSYGMAMACAQALQHVRVGPPRQRADPGEGNRRQQQAGGELHLHDVCEVGGSG